MRFLLPALLLACSCLPAGAQQLPGLDDLPEPTRYLAGYITGGAGWSMPFGGHWGDKTVGFKTSPVLSLAASKRVDEVLSYGVESFYAQKFVNRGIQGLTVKIFSFTPFVRASFPVGGDTYYGVLGAGIYQWRQGPYTAGGTRYGTDSGSSAGISLGAGGSYPFWWGTMAGLDLRWHHIINMNGSNLKLGAVDTLNIMFAVNYSVWKDKKK